VKASVGAYYVQMEEAKKNVWENTQHTYANSNPMKCFCWLLITEKIESSTVKSFFFEARCFWRASGQGGLISATQKTVFS
jgi:hypothetical protein